MKRILILLLSILLTGALCDSVNEIPEPEVGEIYVYSYPDGSDVYLDGVNTGEETNCTLENVSVGTHTIRLVNYGFLDWETTINVPKDTQVRVEAYLEDDLEAIVYITETGSKYHRSDCQYLSQSKIPITKGEAINKGYTACSVCKP